ncbi:hypothetical protein VPH35_106159 [Triticum aestivum]
MVAALQDSQWLRPGADGGVDDEHRRVHGVGVPEGGWRAALHQPPQARPPRRPHRGQGEPHPVPRPRRVLGQELLGNIDILKPNMRCPLFSPWEYIRSRRTSSNSKSV